MTTARREDDGLTAAERAAVIDGACDRFEAEWRAGRQRAIAEHLAEVDAAVRPALEAELRTIALELDREGTPAARADARSAERVTLPGVLAACPTFSFLSQDAREALAVRLRRRTVSAGEAVLVQAAACPGLQIVLRGRLAIEIDAASGGRHRIDEALPGSVVGEIGTLTGRPCTAHVTATERTELLELPATAFAELRGEFPELELALAQLVGDRLGEREFDGLCGKQVGPCRLVRCLGRGGMGVVYEARLIDGGAPVAVKMLRHGLAHDSRAVERFRREAEMLDGLRHDGIVGVADMFVECRTLFLIMELVRGRDLRQIIASQGGVPPAAGRRLLGQIAAAIAHAHARSVIHRDVKPSNVLLDGSGIAKLADFGLARMVAEEHGGGLVGTPRYMPPEQFAGGVAGPAADWYAFGCLAAELLSGSPLFDEADVVAMALAKADWPPRLRGRWTTEDPELAAVVAAAVHPLPECRRLDLDAVGRWAGPVAELGRVEAAPPRPPSAG